MRETRYAYEGVKSVTKLNERHINMLKWWKEFFNKLEDELVAVDNKEAVFKTKTKEIKCNRYLFGNLLGSSKQTVDMVLKDLSVAYEKIITDLTDKNEILEKAKKETYHYYSSAPYKIKEFLNNVPVSSLEFLFKQSLLYKGRYSKEVTYYVYDLKTKIKSLFFRKETDLTNLLKDEYEFSLKFFKDKFVSKNYETIEEMEREYQNIRREELNYLIDVWKKIRKKIIDFINFQEKLIDADDIECKIILKRGQK